MISTHAPLAGRDNRRGNSPAHFYDFNPRAPCGARRDQARDATGNAISTHAPLAGRDIVRSTAAIRVKNFNPRAPCGARPQQNEPRMSDLKISTHAPLAGRDADAPLALLLAGISTHAPLAGRDLKRDFNRAKGEISTHAPLAGRDSFRLQFCMSRDRFQPTRPLRGATLRRRQLRAQTAHFNPRAPCGARQQKCTNHYAHFCDNRQISDAFAQNAACQGILLLFDAGKPCGFWVRTAQVISAHLCFAL